jgi:hypothetical protein
LRKKESFGETPADIGPDPIFFQMGIYLDFTVESGHLVVSTPAAYDKNNLKITRNLVWQQTDT